MNFKHPEILYFLLLLIVPLLVHLFQLRKFKKEYFTNIQILKQLSIQTRKSSKIKKWLLLATRLLLLTFIILAFAQPFFKAKDSQNANNELFIVLDNSFSMEAKGQKGPLLKRAIEDLLAEVPENQTFSLLANDASFFATDIKSIQKDLQNLDYSAAKFDVLPFLSQINSLKSAFGKDILIITDGNGKQNSDLKNIINKENISFYIPKAENQTNVSIDSVYISQTLDDFYEISVNLSALGSDIKPLSIALYNHNKLAAKTILNFEKNVKIQKFTIPKSNFQGKVTIEDNGLSYDNTYFFSISKTEKANVLSIGDLDKSAFLNKIYNETDFSFRNYDLKSLDYNQIEKQDVLILNELTTIPEALQSTLKNFSDKGGQIVIIPANDQIVKQINDLLNNFGQLKFGSLQNAEKQITKIVFEHPLFGDVFEKKVNSFQYPNTKSSFAMTGNANSVLGYADNANFLSAVKTKFANIYVFSAALNKQNSNFQNSPLIVPTFYNLGKNNKLSDIVAFQIGKKNIFIADSNLNKDEILNVKNEVEGFVPFQQILNQKSKLTFDNLPRTSGNFGIYKKEILLDEISFNYPRTENSSEFTEKSVFNDFKIVNSINSFFDDIRFNRVDNQIWKWFLAFALVFLCLEILIQKFVK